MKEFDINENELNLGIKKRKNWTTSGMDGIDNLWWKRFRPAQEALK